MWYVYQYHFYLLWIGILSLVFNEDSSFKHLSSYLILLRLLGFDVLSSSTGSGYGLAYRWPLSPDWPRLRTCHLNTFVLTSLPPQYVCAHIFAPQIWQWHHRRIAFASFCSGGEWGGVERYLWIALQVTKPAFTHINILPALAMSFP